MDKVVIMHRAELNLEALEVPKERQDEVLGLRKTILDEQQKMGYSILKIGECFSRAQDLLPRTFVAFIKTIPGFSTATVYRFMGSYKNARQHLSPPALAAALAAGLDITSDKKSQPFGKFTGLVKKFPPPDKNASPEEAAKWVKTLELAQQVQRKEKMGRAGKQEPRYGDLLRKDFQTIYRDIMRLKSDEQRIEFLTELTSYLAGVLEIDRTIPVKPEKPSDELTEGLVMRPKPEPAVQKPAPTGKKRGRKPKVQPIGGEEPAAA